MTRALAERALAIATDVSKADRADVFVSVSDGTASNARFARNEMTTSGTGERRTVAITIGLGKRHATASSNQSDDRALRALSERALAMARLAPEDPERMPLLGPQTYVQAPSAYDRAFETATPAARVDAIRRAIARADAADVSLAGFLQERAGEWSIASSTGLFAQHAETQVDCTVTARTRDETGSGWNGRKSHRLADADVDASAAIAIDKAVRSAKPKIVPPGKYTVVLEPQAVGEMLAYFVEEMDARTADEGRSYFSGKLGKKLFADFVTFESDPTDPLTPGATFDPEGTPLGPRRWIENGRLNALPVSRYWAQKSGKTPTGESNTFHLKGGAAESVDDLVRGTKRGLLVTRFWYNRMLEPQTILITGLTRDGVFLIEDGRITAPVANFRYNESPVHVLRHVEAMTKTTWRVPLWHGTWRVPALRVPEFTMASTSAAV